MAIQSSVDIGFIQALRIQYAMECRLHTLRSSEHNSSHEACKDTLLPLKPEVIGCRFRPVSQGSLFVLILWCRQAHGVAYEHGESLVCEVDQKLISLQPRDPRGKVIIDRRAAGVRTQAPAR
jgi:hypothetical protein